MMTLALVSAQASECDKADAIDRLQQAEQAGLMLGYKMDQGKPTLYVDRATWNQLNITTRTGMARTFQCAALGEGQVLKKLFIADKGGLTLAEWDGIKGSLNVVR